MGYCRLAYAADMQRSTPDPQRLDPLTYGDHLIEEAANKLQETVAYYLHILEQLDINALSGDERVNLMRKHTGAQNALHALRHSDV